MGQRQSYPHGQGKAEVVINGVVYDVTDFKHPGGSILLNQCNPPDAGFPADATIAFDSLHGQSKEPLKKLSELKAKGKSRSLTPEEIKAMRAKRPYDERLSNKFKTVTRDLKAMGMFDYTWQHLLWRQFEIWAIFAWGAWCALSPGAWFGWFHGATCMGVFMQRSGWFQHECNHGSSSKNHTLNKFLGSFWFGIGEAGSANWWRRAHNRHHADPQRHGADVDMDTLPLALDSLTAQWGSPVMMRIQAWTYQALVWGLVHFWQFWLHPKNILMRMALLDGFFVIMHWALWFMLFYPKLGLASTLALHFFASGVEASLLFTNFALSHTTMPFLHNHVREHWVERSLRRTIDVRVYYSSNRVLY